MVETRQWILNKKPTGQPILEGADATFKQTTTTLPSPGENQLLVKTLYLSNDPAQRTWISAYIDADRHYYPPVPEGDVMHARGMVEVIESNSKDYKKGDHVLATVGWTEYKVVDASAVQPAPPLPGKNKSETLHLGALGTTGLTAYYGLVEKVSAKPSDTVVVSGAAGATGSMVVQIAKNVIGCKKVIGIAGSEEKCKWVESLGADQCLNYKLDSFKSDLSKALPGPDGFADVYFDNVGGEILDLMFTKMARYGRIAACGAISTYNDSPERSAGLKNWFNVVSMRLEIHGFIVTDFLPQATKAREALLVALAKGKLQLERENVVEGSFEEIPKTWMKLFEGGNTGKLVTAVK